MITSRFVNGYTAVYDNNEMFAQHEGNRVNIIKEMQESILDLIYLSDNPEAAL